MELLNYGSALAWLSAGTVTRSLLIRDMRSGDNNVHYDATEISFEKPLKSLSSLSVKLFDFLLEVFMWRF